MKTPMQELIESIRLKDSKDHIVLIPTISKAEIESLLEEEKAMMCEFAYNCHKRHKVYGDFMIQDYYNETFNTKEKMVEDEIDYKKEYYRLYQEVAKMLVENRRNYETPMTPFELLSRWDKIREVKNTFNTKEK